MAIQKLEKPKWRAFFDAVSKLLEGKVAEVEVASLKLGDQTEAEWLPLLGVTYDPRDDIMDIELDGLDHIINKPREIYLDGDVSGLICLEVVDGDGVLKLGGSSYRFCKVTYENSTRACARARHGVLLGLQ